MKGMKKKMMKICLKLMTYDPISVKDIYEVNNKTYLYDYYYISFNCL